ncbi:sigma-54 dependent transcriptional regulator [Acidithiobacillus ferrooxidans]|uniref:sigma-54-dependent transcriptional regulator n=1 Tax=Acidithiobacillus ferrooxidans TaxID=920 RepID=UPI0021472A80|nr:sigma-54 dependent transcriptional regulator [Acidithiobacillus ferrooxidans]MCR1347483.1 sigma-54 dependent transcriptional regulator [Acidithiobacillus ferrooxidans]MCR1355364.1 sigma-54 dependent transcriptional regulator [Acidithiobacillus ferrooxidans]
MPKYNLLYLLIHGGSERHVLVGQTRKLLYSVQTTFTYCVAMVPNSPLAPVLLLVFPDDQEARNLSLPLSAHYECLIANDAASALNIVATQHIDAVICDEQLPDMPGSECLFALRTKQPATLRFLCGLATDSRSINDALYVAAVYEYLRKPLIPDLVAISLKRAVEYNELASSYRHTSHELLLKSGSLQIPESTDSLPQSKFSDLFYCSRAMADVCNLAKQAAATELPVLIYGETGTGKELLARGIHYHSRRQNQAFLAENCGSIPPELLHSELFGHRRGAFTGAISDRLGLFSAADGGTVLLDEIEDMTEQLQGSLLRFLQSGEIKPVGSDRIHKADVRVIAVTNVSLENLVNQGKFRMDLYYRLKGIEIRIPPLRERPEDILMLGQHFAQSFAASMGKKFVCFEKSTQELLQNYSFPGNVRELENEVRRAVALMPSGEPVGPQQLSAAIRNNIENNTFISTSELSGSLKEQVESLEKALVSAALSRFQGNQSRAAEYLGLSRVGLANKIKRYDISS